MPPDFLTSNQVLCDNLINLLIIYEDFEDVVEGVYDVMHVFVQISKALKIQQVATGEMIKKLESSRRLLSIAVRHASLYESDNAYNFLLDLIRASDRFAPQRVAIEKEVVGIKPAKARLKAKKK